MPELTQERLKELLHYDPETGVFTWKTQRRPQSPVGSVAGTHSKRDRIQIFLDGKFYYAHRLAWLMFYGHFPLGQVDHINGNAMDNRISNLRDVSPVVNSENRHAVRSDSRSGLLGVRLHKQSGLWHSGIRVRGKKISLGYHKTPEAAHAAYLAAKRKLHEGCTI